VIRRMGALGFAVHRLYGPTTSAEESHRPRHKGS